MTKLFQVNNAESEKFAFLLPRPYLKKDLTTAKNEIAKIFASDKVLQLSIPYNLIKNIR